jgi:hypothetical protein
VKFFSLLVEIDHLQVVTRFNAWLFGNPLCKRKYPKYSGLAL